MLSPSNVLVPRPISSNISRLRLVALFSMPATSLISTINVLCPPERLSDAPMRVNILSTMVIAAFFAGTNEPMCAISVIIATCLKYVLLPAIFGPVIISRRLSFWSSCTLFGTNAPFIPLSTTGWRPSTMFIAPFSCIFGLQ